MAPCQQRQAINIGQSKDWHLKCKQNIKSQIKVVFKKITTTLVCSNAFTLEKLKKKTKVIAKRLNDNN